MSQSSLHGTPVATQEHQLVVYSAADAGMDPAPGPQAPAVESVAAAPAPSESGELYSPSLSVAGESLRYRCFAVCADLPLSQRAPHKWQEAEHKFCLLHLLHRSSTHPPLPPLCPLPVTGIVCICIGIATLMGVMVVGALIARRIIERSAAAARSADASGKEADAKLSVIPVIILQPDHSIGMALQLADGASDAPWPHAEAATGRCGCSSSTAPSEHANTRSGDGSSSGSSGRSRSDSSRHGRSRSWSSRAARHIEAACCVPFFVGAP